MNKTNLSQVFFTKLINGAKYYYLDLWREIADPRTKDFFLMSNGPWNVLSLILVYLLFATKVGPQFMKERKPFDLRSAMIIYNLVVVLINGYFFYLTVDDLSHGKHNLLNFKFMDTNDKEFYSAENLRIVWLAYLYGWTKALELMDTIFFVLRKKNSQITGSFDNFFL